MILFWDHYFFYYINDLTENLQFAAKLFADDTSLFSNVYDPKNSHSAYKWKMNFNPDLSKQAQELTFSR